MAWTDLLGLAIFLLVGLVVYMKATHKGFKDVFEDLKGVFR